MNIILLGAPGSGKGTQAELIVDKYKLYHFQTGQLARDIAKKDARIKEIIDSGKLIPHEEMTMYAIDFLSKNVKEMTDILFEGFPRFIPQYEALEDFLKTKGDDIDAVISLDINEEEVIKRVSSRRICDKCGESYNLITNPPPSENACECGGTLIQREDDNPDAVKVRLDYYHKNTEELIDYLDKKGKLTRVNGMNSIGIVFEEISAVIDTLSK